MYEYEKKKNLEEKFIDFIYVQDFEYLEYEKRELQTQLRSLDWNNDEFVWHLESKKKRFKIGTSKLLFKY